MLYMSDNEIAVSYKNAKDKVSQIKVLCQLNNCPKESILQILKDKGVYDNPEESKRFSRQVISKQDAALKHTRVDDKKQLLDKLLDQRESLICQISEIDDQISEIVEYRNHIRK